MTEIDLRLADKGRREPREGLAQQGKALVGLAKLHEADLNTAGWEPSESDELAQGVTFLESQVSIQAEAVGGSRDAGKAEQQAQDAAKSFMRRLRNVLPKLLRAKDLPAGVSAESFLAGNKLGRSTPKISAFLTKIRPAVVALDSRLLKYFEQKKASEVLDAVKGTLDTADTVQEATIASLPEATQRVYEAKGKVLEAIEDLNRIAKNAFEKQPELAKKFNKNILDRARKELKKTKEQKAQGSTTGEVQGEDKPAS